MSAATETRDQEAVESEAIAIVNETVAEARAIEVTSPAQAQVAVEFLSKIADARKRSETARKFLVEPLNKHVKAINERFKGNLVPLDEADGVVRGKLLAFQQAEAAELAERQAAEDAARREREAEAEAERRRQAEAAATAEREAREAEERRQAQLRAAANERAREIALMGDEELVALTRGNVDQDVRLAGQEIESRRVAAEARDRAEKARREAEEATQASIALASAPAVSVEATSLSSKSGSAHARQRWVATIEDESRVPREYLMVDTKKINAAVKDGVREIPGVKIEQETGLAVRAGR
jgi:hypothetical protein